MNTVDIYGDMKVIADIINNEFEGEFVDDTFTFIRGNFFRDCVNLTKAVCVNVTSINTSAFQNTGYKKVETSDFPKVNTLNQRAFAECKDLTEVTFPNNLSNYGTYLFENCTNLETVRFPELTTIQANDPYWFSGCTSLKSMYFPKLTRLQGTTSACRMFSNCTSLEEILPTTFPLVTYFPQYGLNGLPNLKKVILPSLTTWGYRVIEAPTSTNLQVLRTPKCGNGFSVDLFGSTGSWISTSLHLVDTNDSNIPTDGLVASRYSAPNLRTIILRNTAMVTLESATGRFVTGTSLNANGSGADIYVPQSLISSYEADTNWSVLGSNGYGTARFHALEGSIYEDPDYDDDIGMED